MKETVFLGLGGNVEPRLDFLSLTQKFLQQKFPEAFHCSSFYETIPFGNLEQFPYYNCCVSFHTSVSPIAVLREVQEIETKVGRKKKFQWDSRIIDIDILLFGQQILYSESLTIPHYDLNRRDFFLVPLLELEDSLTNPLTGIKLSEELKSIPFKLLTKPVRIQEK